MNITVQQQKELAAILENWLKKEKLMGETETVSLAFSGPNSITVDIKSGSESLDVACAMTLEEFRDVLERVPPQVRALDSRDVASNAVLKLRDQRIESVAQIIRLKHEELGKLLNHDGRMRETIYESLALLRLKLGMKHFPGPAEKASILGLDVMSLYSLNVVKLKGGHCARPLVKALLKNNHPTIGDLFEKYQTDKRYLFEMFSLFKRSMADINSEERKTTEADLDTYLTGVFKHFYLVQ